MSELNFYRARQEEMRVAAKATELDNVRERCERAAAAFAELADRAERSERSREQERARRAESGLTSA